MDDKWKMIWNKKKDTALQELVLHDEPSQVFMNLKQAMGVTKIGNGRAVTYDDFRNQFLVNYKEMTFSVDEKVRMSSFFDVGCGSGMYLYLLKNIDEAFTIGGCDYSHPLIETAKEVLPDARELYCGEASELDTSIKYSCVYSRSIFQYFPNEKYASEVVEKMIEKAMFTVGIWDIHDLAKKEEFIDYRRNTIEDYDKKYSDIKHMFYSRQFFIDFAEKHNCGIKFSKAGLANYWNDKFTYDVYLYKPFK